MLAPPEQGVKNNMNIQITSDYQAEPVDNASQMVYHLHLPRAR